MVLNLMPIRHVVCDPTSFHITLSHLTVSEMMNFIRAIFRINHVPIPDPILDNGDVLYQQLMSYEKQRRTMAFDEMKQLNEMSVALQVLQQERKTRIQHQQHISIKIGQVVQHQQQSWRGIVVDWEYHEPNATAVAPSKMSSNTTCAKIPQITYTVEWDEAYQRVASSSSKIVVSIPAGRASNAAAVAVVLTLVTDPQLCRIQNANWSDHFDKFDAATLRFVPNARKAYVYATDLDDTTRPGSVENSRSNVVGSDHPMVPTLTEPEVTQLYTSIIQRVRNFALHLESIMTRMVATEQLLTSTTQPQRNQLLRITGSIRQLDTMNDVKSLSKTLSLQLQGIDSLALQIFKAMFQRRMDDDDDDDDGAFVQCTSAFETELNQWHYHNLRGPKTTAVDQSSSPTNHVVYFHDFLQALQVMDNKEGAVSILQAMQLMRKAHSDILLKSRLEHGVEFMVTEYFERARDIFLSVVTDDPAYVEGWALLGTCDSMMGLRNKAIQSFQKVLELDTHHVLGMAQLGMLHYNNDEYKEAETCFRSCLEIDPWFPVADKLSDCVSRLSKDKRE
jgi:Tetratricopeptide repeat